MGDLNKTIDHLHGMRVFRKEMFQLIALIFLDITALFKNEG
jgi:hypothetical protein